MLEAILLVIALCIDAFVASIAYGTNKIKIPLGSAITINIVCTSLLGISLYLGSAVREIIPGNFVSIVGIVILLIIGIYQSFEGLVKTYIQKYLDKDKKIDFRVFDIKFALEIYVDETKADFNKSSRLNSKEAIALAMALSLDGLAAGFGSGLGNVNYIQVLSFSAIFQMLAVWGGVWIGSKIAQKSRINISWLSGMILIFLALLKIKTI